MFTNRPNRIALAVISLAVLFSMSVDWWTRAAHSGTNAGTIITNRAEAIYTDEIGASYETVSPTVTVTVSLVATLVVTPDETTPSETTAPRERITRLFRVCNTGNNTDSFTVTRAGVNAPAAIYALYFDNDGSGTVTNGDASITVGETVSPQLPPTGCIGVLAVIDTNDAAPQSTLTIDLSARSNAASAANGRGEDSGTIINAVGQGARLTDPGNPLLPPNKLVGGASQKVINGAEQFTYSITFRNGGDVAARNVIIDDPLPSEIEYVPGSLQLNDRGLSDAPDADEGSVLNGDVKVQLARVNPGDVNRITFKAHMIGNIAGGTGVVNTAVLSADNAAPAKSSAATVVINPFGLVFAGRAGSSMPIPGARLDVLLDQNGENFLHLPANVGYSPNAQNNNPFSTDGQSHFSFALASDEIGSVSDTANYFLRVSAQGYITRMIQLGLRPTQAGLFALTVHALDNQPLAVAGGFDLVRQDVHLNDLAALALNVPMFEPSGLQIIKSADRARAEIGDTITYRIEIHNPSAISVSDVTVSDHLPPSFHYAAGSGLIGFGSAAQQPIEPEVSGSDLIFRIGEVPHGETAHLLYRVRVGANARDGAQENLAIASGVFPSGERTTTAPARATVIVSAGVFSTRQVLVGRVFVDTNGDGQFDSADRPAPGVRLYLSNGQSVITDSAGMYNFPSLGDGAQVISLDPVTVPQGYALTDGGRLAGKSWTRLLRTPVGGGALLRQNFALVSTRKAQPESELAKPDQLSPIATPLPGTSAASQPSSKSGAPPMAAGCRSKVSVRSVFCFRSIVSSFGR